MKLRDLDWISVEPGRFRAAKAAMFEKGDVRLMVYRSRRHRYTVYLDRKDMTYCWVDKAKRKVQAILSNIGA